jgi:CubicO group peptidase (beta-lactamase class C family)
MRHGAASLRMPIVVAVIAASLSATQCMTAPNSPTSRPTAAPPQRDSFRNLRDTLVSLQTQYQVPGMTVAVTYRERLVYTDALGFADLESKSPVTPASLFRIASLSKVITEVAILKLVAQNRLHLDDTVFGDAGILGTDYGSPPPGSQIDKITVRHLLEHKSGWTNTPNDPMFNYPGLSQKELISQIVTTRKLSSTPGSTYYYLNFGYSVLGRVIEKITGQTYEAYVQQTILAPCGVVDMQIGRNDLAARLPGEVRYYQAEFSPYNLDLHRMDSHGGWVASAIDLANLLTRIDREPRIADLLAPSQLEGTFLANENWRANGSLPGTTSLMSRLDSDINYVVLANTRTEDDPNRILDAIQSRVSSELQGIRDWPTE